MGESRGGYRITDLPTRERPRERLEHFGVKALSNAELVAILIRVGRSGVNALQLSHQVLTDYGGLSGLHRLSYSELCSIPGIGPAKAAQLQAAVEIGRRLSQSGLGDRPLIQSPQDAANLVLYEMGALEQEHLRVMLLDTRNQLMRISEVYKGSLNSSLIRVGEVFRDALRSNAASILLLHNHPSGDPTPSPEDVSVTRAIVEAGELLDVEVLDHLIIGDNRYTSMKAKGLGFSRQ